MRLHVIWYQCIGNIRTTVCHHEWLGGSQCSSGVWSCQWFVYIHDFSTPNLGATCGVGQEKTFFGFSGSISCPSGMAVSGWYNLPGSPVSKGHFGGPDERMGLRLFCRSTPLLSSSCEQVRRCRPNLGQQNSKGLYIIYRSNLVRSGTKNSDDGWDARPRPPIVSRVVWWWRSASMPSTSNWAAARLRGAQVSIPEEDQCKGFQRKTVLCKWV